ncbi:phytanoyl-CoA dioxygenase family protein [Siccirubricoccus phaeus]|uniref:phytanoyl-CoA dioxygenase family protein n=1 Tax=Siccirubricoccus phaeus TaxID=2595053 RepID=UPI00165BED32|nr:phytanoyl-CoA dioxygenase family protein [Siccirubricoccus phaeus]
MQLEDDQLAAYRRDGYLCFPNMLSTAEIALLQEELPRLLAQDGPQVRRDESDKPRIVYAPHLTSEPYRTLSRLRRLLEPVEQILGEAAYVYQSRVNLKLPFLGDAWSWHQDFSAWHRGDGLPLPRAVMTAVFLEDCTPANGPLLVVPGSQRDGLDEILAREKPVEGYKAERIPVEVLQECAEQSGIRDLSAPAGTVAFIHPTLLHSSGPNLTPWSRPIFYLLYNAVSNLPQWSKRAWFMNNPDTSALAAVDDDALLRAAPAVA